MQSSGGNHKLGDAMKVLICNERFLFRFGLDRVLILIGKGMAERGNDVYMMSYWWDEPIVSQVAKKFIPVPPPTDDYANANESTTKWLENQWHNLFSESEKPDVVIIGGWPFFQALEFFSQVCQTVIFIDAGAVPLDGFVGHPLLIQQKLRNFRQRYLPKATAILPISDFIAKSQTIVDRGNSDGIHTVLLGADHMELSLWQAHMVSQSSNTNLSTLTALKETGRTYILNLGRWEPGCYKNSEACFEVMRRLIQRHPQATLLVLANQLDINIPEDLKKYIKAIGFPDDAELQEIMKNVALGISVSLWEGFNLPLAEMQWLGRPALAFNLAAHPEVVVNPWFLCADVAEMAEKADYVLTGQIPNEVISVDNYNKFRANFRWEKVIQTYCDYLENVVEASRDTTTPILIVDVTNSCRDPANSGVIRVTRQLCRTLQKYCDPVFVVWDWTTEQYILPSQDGYLQLGQFNGPQIPTHGKTVLDNYGTISLAEFLALDPQTQNRPALLFLPETILDPRGTKALAYAKQKNWKSAAILYDLIPVMYPQWCNQSVSDIFPRYLETLSGVDVIIPISDYSGVCVLDYWHQHNIKHGKVNTALLPGEFGQNLRLTKMPNLQSDCVNILCVSTLEPRKNHLTLLEACQVLAQQYPELNWRLTLVGNRYEGAPEISEAVQEASAKDSRIQWLGIVDDATLHQLYEGSTFTVYSSLVEGFGMPVLESVWHGRVCLCHCQGVMAELAAGGGCMVVDMTDAQALAKAIYNLSCDRTLLSELSQAAIDRKLKTWEDYTQEVLLALDLEKTYTVFVNRELNRNLKTIRYEELLYSNCLLDNWQMHDAERMALTGLLAKHQPKCSLEIGTNEGGSLSLISQYSEMVFSIDIDPGVSSRIATMDNVSFVTGASTTVLPLLFQALNEADIPIDFMLLEADHSSNDLGKNIEIILTYVPKQPMFFAIHNSFKAEHRHVIMTAKWHDSPYIVWIDVDFVPGCITEGDKLAKRETRGGLALALFSPTPRHSDLRITASANSVYELALNSRY
ncbi:MAG: glycosyltransferase [Fischerella sp. CENA71]|nr:glycosyltransferase [Fischerella sp. CENA71]